MSCHTTHVPQGLRATQSAGRGLPACLPAHGPPSSGDTDTHPARLSLPAPGPAACPLLAWEQKRGNAAAADDDDEDFGTSRLTVKSRGFFSPANAPASAAAAAPGAGAASQLGLAGGASQAFGLGPAGAGAGAGGGGGSTQQQPSVEAGLAAARQCMGILQVGGEGWDGGEGGGWVGRGWMLLPRSQAQPHAQRGCAIRPSAHPCGLRALL